MSCNCSESDIKSIFKEGRPTMRWVATGEPVYLIDPGPPKVTITDVVVGEYFIDICANCDEELYKYAVYYDSYSGEVDEDEQRRFRD